MDWLEIKNPQIDGAKLQAEIEAEVERLRESGKLPALDPHLDRLLPPSFPSEEIAYILANLEKYSPGIDRNLNYRRAFFLSPLVKFFLRFLGRVLRHQYIFNSLSLEVLRNQEKRIKDLENRLSRD